MKITDSPVDNVWEDIYKQLDSFDHTIIGAEFLPSCNENIFDRTYPTEIRIHVLFGVGSIGIVYAIQG